MIKNFIIIRIIRYLLNIIHKIVGINSHVGKGSRFRVQGFKVQGFKVQGFRVQGFRVEGLDQPLAAEAASLIEKETLEKRISNKECRNNVFCLS
jgi:hypothetical protein